MAHARAGYRIGLAAALMLMTVIFIFRRQIALLFTDEEQIIAGVTASLYVVIASMIFQNGRVVLSGALRGAGDVKFVAVCALLSVTILRPAFTWLFCYPVAGWLPQFPNVAVMGPWIAFLIDSIVRDRLLSHRIKQGKWLNIKLE